MQNIKHKKWLPIVFTALSVALILFSFLVQVMALNAVILGTYAHFIWNFADQHLAAAAGILVLFFLYRCLGKCPRIRRRLTVMAGIVLLCWNLFVSCMILDRYDDDMTVGFRDANNKLEMVSRQTLIWEVYRSSHFIGPADSIYTYPDPDELLWQQESMRPYAIEERNRLKAGFHQWDTDALFPGLSMEYGYWTLVLYLLLILLWSACVCVGWKRLPWWPRLLYGSCVLPLLLLLWGPALGGLGILYYPLFSAIPCRYTWFQILMRGLLQLVLAGRWLWQSEPIPGETPKRIWEKILLCDRILWESENTKNPASTDCEILDKQTALPL